MEKLFGKNMEKHSPSKLRLTLLAVEIEVLLVMLGLMLWGLLAVMMLVALSNMASNDSMARCWC